MVDEEVKEICVPEPLFSSVYIGNIQRGLILDPSCFYSEYTIKVVEASIDTFKSSKIYTPRVTAYQVYTGHKDEFVSNLEQSWSAKKEEVIEAWDSIVSLFMSYQISSIPIAPDNLDLALRAVLAEEKRVPFVQDVLYELIVLSKHQGLPILAFSSGSWELMRRLEAIRERLKEIGIIIWHKGENLHRYKQKNIKPVIEKRLAGSGGVLIALAGAALIQVCPIAAPVALGAIGATIVAMEC